MKLILDENLDENLPRTVDGHEIVHVRDLGWKGLANGALLRAVMSEGFDAFLTTDKNLVYKQNIKVLSFAVVILDCQPPSRSAQKACLEAFAKSYEHVEPGTVYTIPGPKVKKKRNPPK
jgi:hypothetical protein